METPKELPSFVGTVKVEGSIGERIHLHCELEGGYDGAANSPDNDEVFIGYEKIYPSVNRYIQVPEAYLTFALPSTDLRLGIQKFGWGTLDEFNPTDNLSPIDLRHLVDTSSPAERKIGVPAVRLTHLFSSVNVNVEGVWIPFLVPYRLPDPGDRWYPPLFETPETVSFHIQGLPIPLPPIHIRQTNEEARLPARTLAHSDCGLRISRTFGSTDLGLSYFNGYDRMPVMADRGTVITAFSLNPPALDLSYDLHLFPIFDRIQVYGMDMASSFSSFTIRAEGAYVNGRFINVGLNAIDEIVRNFKIPSEITVDGCTVTFPFSPVISYEKNLFSLGAGVDYQWGNYLITLTGLGDYILNYHGEPLVYEEFEFMVILGLHARFWDDTLQVESGLVINPIERLVLSRTDATYAVNDNFSVGANLLLIDGNADSPIGQYRKNDQISVFFEYHF